MKNITAARQIDVQGNLDTTGAVAMGIDAAGMRIVLDTLSGLYSNRELAVVREYSCNARDAHVEARQKRPVEVSLPTPLAPQFRVQDYGTGLSRDQVIKTYAQYGASTKRDSNKMIGAFGIGSKSAFALADNFTVSAVKDGEKTVALFSMTSDGPTVNILLHQLDSVEPNGVLVDVPISNTAAVKQAADMLFQAWQPGQVLVDGREPKSIWVNAEEVAKNVYLDASDDQSFAYGASRFKIVMGGVPYAIPQALWNELPHQLRYFVERSNQRPVSYLFNVSIGAVDITPSREELKVTPRTVAGVRTQLEVLRDSLAGWMSNKMDSAANIWEAGRTFKMLSQKLGHEPSAKNTYWNSVSLGDAVVTVHAPTFTLYKMGHYSPRFKTEEDTKHSVNITSERFDNILYVTEVPDDKLSVVKRHAKIVINEYDGGQINRIVAIKDKEIDQGWYSVGPKSPSPVPHMTFDKYREIALALRKASAGTNAGVPKVATNYMCYVPRPADGGWDHKEMTAADIAALGGQPLVVKKNGSRVNMNNFFVKSKFTEKGSKLIMVHLDGSKRIGPLEKALPTIKPASDYFRALAETEVKGMTQDDLNLFQAHAWINASRHAAIDWLTKHRAQITNTKINDMVDAFNKAAKPSKKDEDRLTLLNHAHAYLNRPTPTTVGKDGLADKLRKVLPFLCVSMSNSWYAEHELGSRANLNAALVEYVNTTKI